MIYIKQMKTIQMRKFNGDVLANNDGSSFESMDDTFDDTVADPNFEPEEEVIVNQTGNRRPTRNFNPLNMLNFHVAFLVDEPNTYDQVMKSPDKEIWMDAMTDEIKSLNDNQTWTLVHAPAGKRVIDNKWVFKIKRNADNSIDRYKARLVVRGFTQEYGIDYVETFRPVIRYTSLRAILSIAAQQKLHIKQFDVKTAF